MRYTVAWEPVTIDVTSGFLADDAHGVRHLMDAVDRLADDPYPPESVRYGADTLRRLHAGRYRAFYEISPTDAEIRIIHVGRVT